jgi:hypothetical protein
MVLVIVVIIIGFGFVKSAPVLKVHRITVYVQVSIPATRLSRVHSARWIGRPNLPIPTP